MNITNLQNVEIKKANNHILFDEAFCSYLYFVNDKSTKKNEMEV